MRAALPRRARREALPRAPPRGEAEADLPVDELKRRVARRLDRGPFIRLNSAVHTGGPSGRRRRAVGGALQHEGRHEVGRLVRGAVVPRERRRRRPLPPIHLGEDERVHLVPHEEGPAPLGPV